MEGHQKSTSESVFYSVLDHISFCIGLKVWFLQTDSSSYDDDNQMTDRLAAQQHWPPISEAPSPANWNSDTLLVFQYIWVVNNLHEFSSGWTQKRLPSMDTEDFETIPSSAEESSNSSEEEGNNKNVGNTKDHISFYFG